MKRIFYSKIIILGSGPSGLTNSLYLLKSNLNPILLTGNQVGGQVSKTNFIDNWPGINFISGFELINNFLNHLFLFNLEIIFDEVYFVDFLLLPYFLFGYINFYFCNFILLCIGTKKNTLKINYEKKFLLNNISFCCLCDGNLYKNKTIFLIGGGSNSLESYIYLKNICKEIIFLNKNKFFSSEFFLLKNFFLHINKNLIFLNSILYDIIFNELNIKYIKFINFYFKIYFVYYTDGLFLLIGSSPKTDFLKGQIKLFKNYVFINKQINYNFSNTNIFSVFSSGDVINKNYNQIIISSGFGCVSAIDCIFLHNKIFY